LSGREVLSGFWFRNSSPLALAYIFGSSIWIALFQSE